MRGCHASPYQSYHQKGFAPCQNWFCLRDRKGIQFARRIARCHTYGASSRTWRDAVGPSGRRCTGRDSVVCGLKPICMAAANVGTPKCFFFSSPSCPFSPAPNRAYLPQDHFLCLQHRAARRHCRAEMRHERLGAPSLRMEGMEKANGMELEQPKVDVRGDFQGLRWRMLTPLC